MERLYRSRRERIIGGVCGGLAEYLRIDPTLIRVVWVVAALIWGAGFLVYLICWLVIPEAPSGYPGQDGGLPWSEPGKWSKVEDRPFGGEAAEPPAEPPPAGAGARPTPPPGPFTGQEPAQPPGRLAQIAGAFLIGLGILALLPVVIPLPTFTWSRLWPVLVVALGILLIVSGVRERQP
ncbi:MAG: PspC domain-containing protein [Clostridia bacterium]|nr:PspC domain-containing protein [Clostridia bacterium]